MSLGFIILRHVNNEHTGKYWERCYECIRKYYKDNPIMIIDDNSDYSFIDSEYESKLENVQIIKSEYPKRGELLPYIYYQRNKFCDKVVILHDSVYINSNINLDCYNYKFLWTFHPYHKEDKLGELKLLSIFRRPDLSVRYRSNKWVGCFGGMSIVSYEFLTIVNRYFNLNKLIPFITNRKQRSCFERVLAIIFITFSPLQSLLGDIHHYCKWGGNDKDMYNHLPIIKIWTGR